MLHDLQDFGGGLLRRWGALLSGVVVTVALGVIPSVEGWHVPSGIWKVALVGTVLWAAFLAWRDEHRKVRKLEIKHDADLTKLAQLRTTAVNLQARSFDAADRKDRSQLEEWFDDHKKWSDEVAKMLQGRFPVDQWSRFTSLGELEAVAIASPIDNPTYVQHRHMLRKQLAILESLMDELRLQVKANK